MEKFIIRVSEKNIKLLNCIEEEFKGKIEFRNLIDGVYHITIVVKDATEFFTLSVFVGSSREAQLQNRFAQVAEKYKLA